MIYVTGKLGLDVARVISFPIGCSESLLSPWLTMTAVVCGVSLTQRRPL